MNTLGEDQFYWITRKGLPSPQAASPRQLLDYTSMLTNVKNQVRKIAKMQQFVDVSY